MENGMEIGIMSWFVGIVLGAIVHTRLTRGPLRVDRVHTRLTRGPLRVDRRRFGGVV